MAHINKPLALRIALGLDHTEAGQLIMGIKSKKAANDTWKKMERDNADNEKLSNFAREHLNMVLLLVVFRNLRTPGAYKALDLYLEHQKGLTVYTESA